MACAQEDPCSENLLDISEKDFKNQLKNIPDIVALGIFQKSSRLLERKEVVKAPGRNSLYIVSSEGNPNEPHMVVIGKRGEVRCDRKCPNWNGIRICSHVVATAQCNDLLKEFLTAFGKKKSNFNLTKKGK